MQSLCRLDLRLMHFYDSPYEPWSEWLTGVQGKAPEPYYDPLSFAIEETHKRGMEFHAWFNPYRAVSNWNEQTEAKLSPKHMSQQIPAWFVQYGANLYFDPGIPQARDYVIEVILDVVKRYDIDAVHFDDYFYPYPEGKEVFPDSLTYAEFGRGFPDIEAWRRNNVDGFIERLNAGLKLIKPHVQFGISPFGVWRNKNMDA